MDGIAGRVFSEQHFSEVLTSLQSKGVFREVKQLSPIGFEVSPHKHKRVIKLAVTPKGIIGSDATRILFEENATPASVEQQLAEAMKKYEQ